MKNKPENYSKVHGYLHHHYGNATYCSNPDCPGESINYQWALKKGCDYEKNIENFIQLCVPCHKRYDGYVPTKEHNRKVSEAITGRKLSRQHIENMSKGKNGIKTGPNPKLSEYFRKKREENARLE